MGKVIELIFDSGLAKLFLTVAATIGGIILYKYLKKEEINQAGNQSGNQNIGDKQDLIGGNKQQNDQAQSDSQAVDDFLKKEKP